MRRSVVAGFGLGVASGYWAGRRRDVGPSPGRAMMSKVSSTVRHQAELIISDPEDAAVVITRDHRRLAALAEKARRCPIDHRDDQGRSRALVQRLIAEASAHEVVEEWHVWPAVRDLLAAGPALVEKAGDQELELKRVLHTLDARRPGDPDYLELIDRFIDLAATHIAFEEQQVWPQLCAVLRRRDRIRLGRTIVKAKRRAPTRPHPSDFADPEKHPLLLQSVGLVERGLDRLTARGELVDGHG